MRRVRDASGESQTDQLGDWHANQLYTDQLRIGVNAINSSPEWLGE